MSLDGAYLGCPLQKCVSFKVLLVNSLGKVGLRYQADQHAVDGARGAGGGVDL